MKMMMMTLTISVSIKPKKFSDILMFYLAVILKMETFHFFCYILLTVIIGA